ncbi:MAG: LysM peptidoglycan-binding domain-containing protein [Chitinispirillia bacterium]|jgi:nucleoid-associated protein YgaU
MLKFNYSLYGLLGVVLILQVGCSKRPDDEINRAEDALSNARQAGAEKWASSTFNSALNNYKEAMALVDKKKYKESIPLLETTVGLADAASQEAMKAKRAEEERLAAEAEKKAAEASPDPVEESASEVHTVRKGENLWVIAGYDNIYNDSWKWRRIFDVNKDKITDPDLIYPDQVLRIPR